MADLPSLEEYTRRIKAALQDYTPDVVADINGPHANVWIKNLYRNKYSINDAIRHFQLTSDALDEGYACKQLELLDKKYKK